MKIENSDGLRELEVALERHISGIRHCQSSPIYPESNQKLFKARLDRSSSMLEDVRADLAGALWTAATTELAQGPKLGQAPAQLEYRAAETMMLRFLINGVSRGEPIEIAPGDTIGMQVKAPDGGTVRETISPESAGSDEST